MCRNNKNSLSKKIKIDKKILGFYLIIIILFVEWFYNHPSLRYGGFSLIALVFFIPSSIYFSKFLSKKNFERKIIILITISLIIFIGRNINRLNYEIKNYNYSISTKPFYLVDENHFRINKSMKKIKQNYNDCKKENSLNCNDYNGIVIKRKNNYFFLINKK